MHTLKKLITSSMVLLFLALLSGCSNNVRHAIGIKNTAPDEFKVVSNPPLSLPPNFNLRPPRPGAANLHSSSIIVEAKELVFEVNPTSRSTKNSPSKGEYALLKQARTFGKEDNIRDILDEELRLAKLEEEEKGFFDRVIGLTSSEKTKNQDPIIDATKEKQRINETKKQGKILDGEDTPIASNNSDRSFFSRILGL